jgi:hypothetical protein
VSTLWSSEEYEQKSLAAAIIAYEAKGITNELELLKSLFSRANAEGYLVVATPGNQFDSDESPISAAGLLRLSESDLKRAFRMKLAMPVARVSSITEAERLRQELKRSEFESIIVPENVLQLNRASRQIRALIMTPDCVTAVGSGNRRIATSWNKIRLIVQGRLFSQRIETEESNRGHRTKVLNQRELLSDEAVLDIYTTTDEVNWRIGASNFDFSCLGAAKQATAFENFSLLVELLGDRAAGPLDDAYLQIRPLLNLVWPLENRTTIEHGRRNRARKFDRGTITTTDNQAQFTRYSKLRHYLTSLEPTPAA